MRIGAHQSIAGGLHLAFDRALADGAESLQIFTKSSRQWASKPISDEDAAAFRAARQRTGLPVIGHGSYLINLGAESGDVRCKSLAAFQEELRRCEHLGVPWLVSHPGAHSDETTGLKLIADGLRASLDLTAGARVGILLEITAGQGSCLGYCFDHIRQLLDQTGRPERMGICLDTCHLYAAGYDIATDDGYAAMVDELDRLIGRAQVQAIHLNDAKKELGSRVDRHEHIGEGTLGLSTFARFVRDPGFGGVTGVLETLEGKWREEIALLRSLRDATVAQPKELRIDSGGLPRTDENRTKEPTKCGRRRRPAADQPIVCH